MALTVTEFDTTLGELTVALRNAILTCTDWAKINTNPTIQSTSANAAVAATALTFASTTGFAVGQKIKIGSGPTTEYKNITATTGTTITFASQGLINAQASGTPVSLVNEVFKCTTTRGADMIFEIEDALTTSIAIACWKSHDGTTGTDRTSRWLYHRAAAPTSTSIPLHVVLSLSKEHIFFSIEGPRANESGATSATVGSLKNYFFMDDVVPYHAGDTNPVVFAGGGMAAAAAASAANNSHQGNFSRNYANTTSWSVAKLLSLDFPSVASTETIQVTHATSADGKFYLAPYVAFGDESGIRGRLSNFFFAGYNHSDTPEIATPPINQKVTFGGKTYKLLAVHKSDGATFTWGQFGSALNNTTSIFHRSPIVAVPWTA